MGGEGEAGRGVSERESWKSRIIRDKSPDTENKVLVMYACDFVIDAINIASSGRHAEEKGFSRLGFLFVVRRILNLRKAKAKQKTKYAILLLFYIKFFLIYHTSSVVQM